MGQGLIDGGYTAPEAETRGLPALRESASDPMDTRKFRLRSGPTSRFTPEVIRRAV